MAEPRQNCGRTGFELDGGERARRDERRAQRQRTEDTCAAGAVLLVRCGIGALRYTLRWLRLGAVTSLSLA